MTSGTQHGHGPKRRRGGQGGRAGGSRAGKDLGPKREHIAELAPVDTAPAIDSFTSWNLGEEIQRAIANMDIRVPTPIQALSIGPVLEGKDVIAKAETGTGKTLAFGAPMMARIDPARATVLGLVLCPTRELAQQVAQVLAALGLERGIKVVLVVGGDPMQPQVSALKSGAQVVVGTPGRVLDLYQQRFLSFPWTEFAILDEADKMFEIGFLDDVRKILSFLPDERQTLLFSATFPTEVLKLARDSTRSPVEVSTASGTATVDAIEQFWMEVEDEDKPLVLTRILEQSRPRDIFIVFMDRKMDVDRLMRRLERLPFPIKALHGDYDQASRFRVMTAFRTGDVKVLIATDVAARGLDVLHVTHVLNWAVPRELEDYTHRIGRTGRAGRSGTAITFVCPRDSRRWLELQQRAKWLIEQVPAPGRSRGRAQERDARPDTERDARPDTQRDARPDTQRDARVDTQRDARVEPTREERREPGRPSQRALALGSEHRRPADAGAPAPKDEAGRTGAGPRRRRSRAGRGRRGGSGGAPSDPGSRVPGHDSSD